MIPKKNILFLINDLSGGGAEKVLVNLVNNLNKDKYNITVRTLIDRGANKQYLNNTVTYEFVFNESFRGVRYLDILPSRYIYNKVAHGRFDVIVVYLQGILTRIVAKAPIAQKTITFLHTDTKKSGFVKKLKAKGKLQDCFGSYNAIVPVSKSIQESFKEVTGIEKNIHLIYNTFDVEGIREKSREKIAKEQGHQQALRLTAVGTLKKIKGFDRLINVLGRLKREGIDFSLKIIGQGSDRVFLQQLIEENDLNNNVFLVGFQNNPYKFIINSDLFISASHQEGFSSVVVESIILGVPVITTECAGMREILGVNSEYGMVVNNDEESLYHGLKKNVIG